MSRLKRRTPKKATLQQTNLLKKIKEKEEEILAHEKEAGDLQMQEHFDYANDEKAEADGCARTLKKLLEEASDLGMNTQEFPIVEHLVEKYITIPNRKFAMAGGSSCH